MNDDLDQLLTSLKMHRMREVLPRALDRERRSGTACEERDRLVEHVMTGGAAQPLDAEPLPPGSRSRMELIARQVARQERSRVDEDQALSP